MALVPICVIVQPCIICEADMEVWTVLHDQETGAEEISVEALDHTCSGLRRLYKERTRSGRMLA